MTMNLPMISALDLTGYPVDYRALTDMTPFTYRAGMTYEGLLESIRAWIPNTLIPYLNDNFAGIQDSWIDNVASVESQLESALQAIATAQVPISDPVVAAAFAAQNSLTRAAMDARYVRSGFGSITAPEPTGIAATDTANLQAAITTAQAANADLVLTPSPTGVIRAYVVTAKLTWDISRGSIRGRGQIALDFSQMPAGTTGAAFTVTGPNATTGYSHTGSMHRLEGFQIIGHNTDTSTMDGLLFQDAGMGLDQALIESVMVTGFRDNITFGANAWSLTFNKVFVSSAHRYGVNLTVGSIAGECITFTNSTISGSHNAAGTAIAIYSPPSSAAGFRMLSGSLDYNDTQGRIEGGALSFHGVHIEDNRTSAMFVYTQSVSITSVAFRDCTWTSAAPASRPYLHQVLPGSGSKVTVTFDGDKGGLYPNTYSTWFTDASNNIAGDLGISSYVKGQHLDNTYLVGQFYNLLANGDFGSSSSFVTSGTGGWSAPGAGTWTIGAGGSPGAGLTVVATGAITATTSQRIALPASRQPVRVAGKMLLPSATAGGIQAQVQFYAADGTTPILGVIRIGSSLTTVDAVNWTYFQRRFTPPPGAAYLTVGLAATGLTGTGVWDEIEVVPV